MDKSIFVILAIVSIALLWIIYQISFIRSLIKYKYSWWWLLLTSTLLFFYSPLIYILQANRENTIIKKQADTRKIMVGKLKLKFAIVCFIFYFVSAAVFSLGFNHYLFVTDVYKADKSILCVNMIMILMIPLYLYLKKQLSKII